MKLIVYQTSRFSGADTLGADAAAPRDWIDVLQEVAVQLGSAPAEKLTWRSLLGSKSHQTVVTWQPSGLVLAATWLGQRVIYLCWGLPSRSSLATYLIKLARLRSILSNSSVILVNDPVTMSDVARLSGRAAVLVPYVVDTDFFEPGCASRRSNILLVPGSNDRNEKLVSEIAASVNRKVIRVTQARSTAHIHSGSSVEVQFNIPAKALANLYQQASCVLLPISSNNHAAGQTAILEAVASGVPVVVSKGRSGALAQKFPSVIIPASEQLDDWLGAIAQADQMLLSQRSLLEQCAAQVRRDHSPSVVSAELMRVISSHASK